MAKKIWTPRRVWDYWQAKWVGASMRYYGTYLPNAGLCVALMVSAGEEGDIDWINSDVLESCAKAAGLEASVVRKCLLNSIEFLDGKRDATFDNYYEIGV